MPRTSDHSPAPTVLYRAAVLPGLRVLVLSLGSPVTAARYAMRRGESTFDHGPQLLDVAIPVRAAIDAHQRYLRGEFS